ncbi:hypothetical phage protein [Streptococcus equi subsp. equi 4047]|uniref:Hypothetical phage protein n=1 Tax=Streptococcus equi subsp. equi (strain 4047) TaxID=553482 RepID=C0MBL6_STRE4|nr:hypothetical phage protein [Streptococcus equi subsp. equi 4047]
MSLLTTSKVATLVFELAVNHKNPHIRTCLPLKGYGVAPLLGAD